MAGSPPSKIVGKAAGSLSDSRGRKSSPRGSSL